MNPNAFTPTPSRYTHEQLAMLLEISSTVKCECPNHLARIVTSLLGFEEYARDCENLNAEDARIHRLLYEHANQARAVLDEALTELIAHEGIELD